MALGGELEPVKLNGRPLPVRVVPVNPALDREAVKAYVDRFKDGLDSIGVEAGGHRYVLAGIGLPKGLANRLENGDRLTIGTVAAKILFQENEDNSPVEYAKEILGRRGPAFIVGGFLFGAVVGYLGTLFGLVSLPVVFSVATLGIGCAALAMIGGLAFTYMTFKPKLPNDSILRRIADGQGDEAIY